MSEAEQQFPDVLGMPEGSVYTARYPMAMAFAAVKHAAQRRKDVFETPYISHPVAVSVLVFQYVQPDGLHAGDVAEDLAIAALLHDVAEDAGGAEALAEILAMFGDRVAEIVDHCSDAMPAVGEAKAPWRGRKEAHIERIRRLADDRSESFDPGTCLVISCDKLHNLEATAGDVLAEGESALAAPRFKGGPEGTRWYYRTLRDVLAPAIPTLLLQRLDEQLQLLGAADG